MVKVVCDSEVQALQMTNALKAAESVLWDRAVACKDDAARFAELTEHRYRVQVLTEGVTVAGEEDEGLWESEIDE